MARMRRTAGRNPSGRRSNLIRGFLGAALAIAGAFAAVPAGALEPAFEHRQASAPLAGAPVTPPDRQPRLAGPPQLRALQLSWADAERYRRVFELQEAGDWAGADAIIRLIRDDRLMGHVRYQRLMHPTAWKASYGELRDWLEHYADHPGAGKIHQLALRRQGEDDPHPRAPRKAGGVAPGPLGSAGLERTIDVTPRRRAAVIPLSARERAAEAADSIARHLRAADPAEAEAVLVDARLDRSATPVEADAARIEVAAGYFYDGRHRRAYDLARLAAERSGDLLPQAHWIAGLSAWHLGQIERAAGHFEALARIEDASPWTVSAGAYWAARAHARLKRPAEHARWVALAAEHPRTFYGMIAGRTIGSRADFRFRVPTLTARHIRAIGDEPAALRAVALVQAGRRDLAEQELRRVDPRGKPLLGQALVALVDAAGLPAFALQIGSALAGPGGTLYDAALYPVPPWQPAEGFKVDRALLYALMRRESRFDHRARSAAGASGLMQLMPTTASYMAEGRDFSGGDPGALFEPELNLELGQRYVSHLFDQRGIGSNLLLMAAGYNAGPGALQRWRKRIKVDDPLLFLESLPSAETRNFVEQVLTNFWIYRQRLGQPDPSLDAIAAGKWPAYIPMDAREDRIAEHAEN